MTYKELLVAMIKRRTDGMKNYEIADWFSVTPAYMGKILAGDCSTDTLESYAKRLGVVIECATGDDGKTGSVTLRSAS